MSTPIIKPKGSIFKPDQQRRIIQNTLTATAKGMQADFGVTTQTWGHRPDFRIDSPMPFERTVSTGNEVYAMLDAGTQAHTIRPKKPRGILRFTTPFKSKTLPNQIMSRAGSKGSSEAVARVVHHPGTAPRRWAKAIAAKWQKQIGVIFQRALDAEV